MSEVSKQDSIDDLRLFVRLLSVTAFFFIIHFFISYVAARAILLSYATNDFARIDAALNSQSHAPPPVNNFYWTKELLLTFPTKSITMPSQVEVLPKINVSSLILNSLTVAIFIQLFGLALSSFLSKEHRIRRFFDGRR